MYDYEILHGVEMTFKLGAIGRELRLPDLLVDTLGLALLYLLSVDGQVSKMRPPRPSQCFRHILVNERFQ